ncbi:MAG: hypothetical protein VW455_05850 [Nitrospinota bacterium]
MKSVKIKFIREGMVTATEVKDRMGRTLLTQGKTITSKHLKVFKTWGVTEVNIMLPEDTSVTEADVENPIDPKIISKMDELFKFTDRRHPIVNELYNLCLARKAKSLGDTPE